MTENLSTERRKDIDVIIGTDKPYCPDINSSTENPKIEKLLQLVDPKIKKIELGGNLQNCFSYALDIQEEVLGEVVDLIVKKINFRKEGNPGDIIWYFKDGIVNHAGKFISPDVVRSKWGTFSVFEHPLFSIPQVYGDLVLYSSIPDKSLIEQHSLNLLAN